QAKCTRYSKRYERLNKAKLRCFEKVKNRVRQAHYQWINWLVNNYDVILLPKLETARLVKSKSLSRTTKRQMLAWSHSMFIQRLADKIACFQSRYKRLQVIHCSEHSTSKTCGKCGHLNRRLGSNKVFRCPQVECHYHS